MRATPIILQQPALHPVPIAPETKFIVKGVFGGIKVRERARGRRAGRARQESRKETHSSSTSKHSVAYAIRVLRGQSG